MNTWMIGHLARVSAGIGVSIAWPPRQGNYARLSSLSGLAHQVNARVSVYPRGSLSFARSDTAGAARGVEWFILHCPACRLA